ncbi:polymorphic toxin type 47 domain-containing protein [Chryseobacterium scophthalmum]|uniref:polymorphic toxin type 47 domain-containing protein n=1 Tax=Chryseobacterium scophthalmum TaxID=59733 RepID=UPI001AEC3F33|nr:polymorphic toxin type 47 domain-containing protein [Chryseobacterium scophthalmum]
MESNEVSYPVYSPGSVIGIFSNALKLNATVNLIYLKGRYSFGGGKFPVEYQGPGGANVNMDIPAFNNVKEGGRLGEGPHQPHIGYQTPGRKANRIRGHIFIDNIPTSR